MQEKKRRILVKYGLLGIEKEIRGVKTTIYVVSKFYLLHTEIDKALKKHHEVVFSKHPDYPERFTPEYKYNGECFNSVFVSEVFENFEEAKEEAENKNAKTMFRRTSTCNLKETKALYDEMTSVIEDCTQNYEQSDIEIDKYIQTTSERIHIKQ